MISLEIINTDSGMMHSWILLSEVVKDTLLCKLICKQQVGDGGCPISSRETDYHAFFGIDKEIIKFGLKTRGNNKMEKGLRMWIGAFNLIACLS